MQTIPVWEEDDCGTGQLGRVGGFSLHAAGGGEHAGAQEAGAAQVRFDGVLSRGGLPSNSGYRESVTAQSVRKVEPASADVEADGREEPNPGAGRGKGLCCTEGRPAKRLKRVFNGAAFMPSGAGIDVSVCSACGAPMKIIAGMPNHSIEDPTVIGKLLSHLETTSCPPPAGLEWCAVGARAPPPGSC